jgi:predicted ATPase
VKQIASSKDYRQSNKPLGNSYYTPINDESKNKLFNDFIKHSQQHRMKEEEMTDVHELTTTQKDVPVMMGRTVRVTVANESSDACFVDFKYLCETDRGASDYHAICAHFDTVYLYGIPVLSVLEHDRARRFITLIDEVYDAGIHLIWVAENEPNSIFKELTPVEIIIEKKEGRKFGTDHNWGTDPNAPPGGLDATYLSGGLAGKKEGTNAWLDQSAKTDIYPAVSREYKS